MEDYYAQQERERREKQKMLGTLEAKLGDAANTGDGKALMEILGKLSIETLKWLLANDTERILGALLESIHMEKGPDRNMEKLEKIIKQKIEEAMNGK